MGLTLKLAASLELVVVSLCVLSKKIDYRTDGMVIAKQSQETVADTFVADRGFP